MSFRCFHLVTFILLLSGAQGLIQFTQEPSSLIVRPSESVWWHCTARLVGSSTALTYMWFMGDELIVTDSNRELFQNGTFHIREASRSDTGTYLCRAQGGGEIAFSQTGSLSIAELAPSFSTNPQSMSIHLGTQMSLSCSIKSNPQATIKWLFDGSPFDSGDVTATIVDVETESRLTVAAVEHRHGGQYRCSATNSLLSDQIRLSDPATVTLIGRPGFMTVPSPRVALVGSSTSFQCTTSGSPAATIVWQNENGETIQSSSRFLVSSNSLRIIDVQLSDEGYYTCKAFNEYGENTASALLTVTDSFEPVAFTVTPTDQTVVVGGRVTFACGAIGTPEPTLTWSKENSELPNERIDEPAPGWLRISDVEVKDSGLFICNASNGLSHSSRSVQLTVLEGPYFISEPEPVTVEENHSAMLDCVAGGAPEPEITWTTPITSLGTLQTPSRPSSTIEVAGNGSLIISSAKREHGGSYRCSATNTIGSIQSDVMVTVHARPVIVSAPSDLVTIEGDTVMLICRAESIPPVTEIIWTYQSDQISTNLKFEVFGNGNLRISNIEKDQEGMYSCQAENDIGRSTAASAYVTVQVPPKVTVHPADVTLDLGSDVILHCLVSGDPVPSLEWKKDDDDLVLTENVIILANFSLEIRDFRRENAGSYRCIATNAAGDAHATAVVMATDIPEFITPAVNITANQTQSALLPCRATAREVPMISWYLADGSGVRGEQIGLGENIPGVRGFQSVVTDEGDLFFSVVTREDEGWFICQARNSIDTVEMMLYLTINYPPSITTSSVQITGEGTSLRAILKCDSEGKPFPTVSWYLPDGDLVESLEDRYYVDVVGISSYLVIYEPEVVSHSGDFRCEANNILGSSFNLITVSIEGIPVIVKVSADPSFGHVTLRCLSKGTPSPQIFWFLNDITANSIPSHSVLSDGSLVVTDLDVAETGRYRCLLRNRYGSASAFLEVPGRPSTPEIESITSRSITISWLPPDETSNLTVSSYQVEYFQFAGNGTILDGGNTDEPSQTIENLAPYTGYQFRVLARNGLGSGPYSDFSQVVVTAEGVPETVQNMGAEVSGTNIIVSWSEPRRVNGNKGNIVYVIIYGPANETLDDHVTLTRGYNDEKLVVLPDLLPSVLYRITMRVVNTDFNLQSPDTVTEVNTSFPVPVMVLSGFKIAHSSSNSILVKWTAINPPAFLRYIISYHDNSSITRGEFIHIYINNPADEYLIKGLNPTSEYMVKMTYQTEGGIAPYTRVLIVSTVHASTTEPIIEPNRRSLSVGAIIGVVFGVLLLIMLVLLLLVLYRRWRQSKDTFSNNSSPAFDPDSLWINRRFSYGETISLNSTVDDSGSEKKGTYEVAIVNENYDPGDTLMSNDSAYDLAKTDLPEAAGGHLIPDGPKGQEKKKKKKKKWGDDLIYKDPLNPDVVLVKKAVLGEDLTSPQPVSSREILNQDDDTPNTTLDPPDTPTDATPEGDFPIFTNSPHDEVVLAEDYVVKDNAKQEKLNKKARERKKKQEKEEQKERDRDFDIGYRRQKKSVADMFNVTGRFSRRRNSSMDEIPYPEEGELAGPSAAKHGDSAVLY